MKDLLSKLSILALILGPSFAFAQSPGFILNQNPLNPGPGDSVSFSISSVEINLDLADIVWIVDGQVALSGKGIKSFNTKAPSNGGSKDVSVEVSNQNIGTLKKNTKISSAEVDLLWEAQDSYVPPFYKGKALPVKETGVKVVAMPSVKTSPTSQKDPSTFVYSWRKDGSNAVGRSGLGKNSFYFTNEILDRDNRIEVIASDGSRSLSGSIIFTPFEPEMLFYENYLTTHPVFKEAIVNNSYLDKIPTLDVVVEPFFLSKAVKGGDRIDTRWSINGQNVNSRDNTSIKLNIGDVSKINLNFTYDDKDRIFGEHSGAININIR